MGQLDRIGLADEMVIIEFITNKDLADSSVL